MVWGLGHTHTDQHPPVHSNQTSSVSPHNPALLISKVALGGAETEVAKQRLLDNRMSLAEELLS